MIRKALILAAGRGARLNGQDLPRPLVPIAGVPLLARGLRAVLRVGIEQLAVVVGYRADEVRDGIEAIDDLRGRVRWIENPGWAGPIGRSVEVARDFFDERALLLLGDRLLCPDILESLIDLDARSDESLVVVDRDVARVYDLADSPKVRLAGARVVDLGKEIEPYDAVSTGVLLASRALVDAIAAIPDAGLNEGVRALGGRGLMRWRDVGGLHWQDVSTAETKKHAEWMVRAYGEELSGPAPIAESVAGDPRRTLAYIEGLLGEKNARHYVLLNPGPVNTSPRVKSALVHYDVCHRDSDYSEVVRRLERKLRRVFAAGPEHAVLLLTGSGTSAMEAAISSTVPPGRKLLVVANGAFGERFVEIAALHGIETVVVASPWGALPDPEEVRRRLAADPAIFAVAMIHHETSVGLINPVREVGAACRDHDRLLILDAVASLGGEELDVVRDHVDVCFSSANKCLHAPSGISFVCVHPRVWARIADVKPRVYYLDLKRYRDYAERHAQTPFTPAVSTFFALDAALDELLAEGVAKRIARYRRRNGRIRAALAALGCTSLTATGRESITISCARVPDGVRFDDLYAELKARGYIVYDCKDALKGRYFQVANMGEISDAMIEAFLAAFAEVLGRLRRQPIAAARPAPQVARA